MHLIGKITQTLSKKLKDLNSAGAYYFKNGAIYRLLNLTDSRVSQQSKQLFFPKTYYTRKPSPVARLEVGWFLLWVSGYVWFSNPCCFLSKAIFFESLSDTNRRCSWYGCILWQTTHKAIRFFSLLSPLSLFLWCVCKSIRSVLRSTPQFWHI